MAKLELVGANDWGLDVVMGAYQSIGYKGILSFGTLEQKQKYLAAGRKFAAFCLTEPGSSDTTKLNPNECSEIGDGKHYVLNGTKIWISNSGFAEVFTVFAQTPIVAADGSKKEKVSFIVECKFGGQTNGPPEKKLSIQWQQHGQPGEFD